MAKKGLSGSTLKMIAIITMFIDHVGAAVLGRFLVVNGIGDVAGTQDAALQWVADNAALYGIYTAMRAIGRIAFPIFCFLLVEGFEHTKDCRKYAIRLGIFALISEIPFDLAFNATWLETGYQNVFFTLFLGLLAMMGYRYFEEKPWGRVARTACGLLVIVLCMGAAQLLQTDYAAKGIFVIMVLYLFRKNRSLQVLAGCMALFWWELPALLAFIPIAFYNGKRGWNIKYIFYGFYPVHLLILYLVCCLLGVGNIAVV